MRVFIAIHNGSAPYSLEIGQVGRVQSAGNAAGHQTLHQEGNTEDVHASTAQDLDLGSNRPGIVGSQGTRDGRPELSTRLADTDPYVLLASCTSLQQLYNASSLRSSLTSEASGALLLNAALVGDNVTATGVSNGHASSASGQNHVGKLHFG